MVEGKTLIISSLAVLLLGVGIVLLIPRGPIIEPLALSFEECVDRGFLVSEGVPRACTTPEGISFVEDAAPLPAASSTPQEIPRVATTSSEVPAQAACVVGGCSSQLCIEEGDPGVSSCEYRAEYACYREARCERQKSGQCGWTDFPELSACLENPPEL